MTLLGKYLASRSLKQEAFASASGVPAPMVSLYVSGQRRPGLTYALAIQEATKGEVPASYWSTFRPTKRRRSRKRSPRAPRPAPLRPSHA